MMMNNTELSILVNRVRSVIDTNTGSSEMTRNRITRTVLQAQSYILTDLRALVLDCMDAGADEVSEDLAQMNNDLRNAVAVISAELGEMNEQRWPVMSG